MKVSEELSKEGLSAWKGLLLAHATLVEQIDKVLEAANLLPLDWYDVLLALEDSPDQKLKMSELAEQVLLSKSGLTRLADRIEAKGYICRQGCKNDRRVAYAKITPEGLKARKNSWPTYRKAIAEFYGAHMSPDEAATVGQVLLRFVGRHRERGSCGGQAP